MKKQYIVTYDHITGARTVEVSPFKALTQLLDKLEEDEYVDNNAIDVQTIEIE